MDGVEDRAFVERHQRAQVEHADARLLDLGRRLERRMDHRAVGDHDEIVAVAHRLRAQRRLVEALGNLAAHTPIEVLVLEEDDRVGIGDRREQQPLGVVRSRGCEHLQAGSVHEPGLGIL